jgi:hypothetical protein
MKSIIEYSPDDYLNTVYYDSDNCKSGSNVVIRIEFTIKGVLYSITHSTTDYELIWLKKIIEESICEGETVSSLNTWLKAKRDLCLKNYNDQN